MTGRPTVSIGGEEFAATDFASALDLIDAWQARDLEAALRVTRWADSLEGLLAAAVFVAASQPGSATWVRHLRAQLLQEVSRGK